MKTAISLFLLIFTSNFAIAQTAYIQVNGEVGLSVYLNGQFKGKTTAEYNGLIIENVTPGQNLIKIVKEGFTPFEEYITVKPGEVFAYNVKPFTKHLVEISQQGHTDETDKKVIVQTGKLIVQSVPIEILITIPKIEGVNQSPKTKDEWTADKIPTGSYEISFTYGQKNITKSVIIENNSITSVFINMLNGEFTVKTKLEPKQQKTKDSLTTIRVIDSLCMAYKFKRGLSEYEFRSYNPEAANLIALGGGSASNGQNTKVQKRDQTPGPYTYMPNSYNRPVYSYVYILFGAPSANDAMMTFYNQQLAYYQRIIPPQNLRLGVNCFSIDSPTRDFSITFFANHSGSDKQHKFSYVDIHFYDSKTYPRH